MAITREISEGATTAKTVAEWKEIVESRGNRSLITMDSYYIDNQSRGIFGDSGTKYIAAMRADRFRSIVSVVSRNVNKCGDTSFAYNKETKEVCVHHWSVDATVGKKVVLSNAFKLAHGKQKLSEIPVYDHYKVSFNGCDKFNTRLANRNFIYRPKKSRVGAVNKNMFDYMFTSTIINVWHASITKNPTEHYLQKFHRFCHILAVSLVRNITSYIPSQ